MKKGDHLFLVDGSGYIFRAYHALPPLTRKSDGLPVGAVSGFCNMLWKLLSEARDTSVGVTPTHFAVIFDYSSKTFRNELYPEYKANRSAPPEDLVPQFAVIREATRAFDLPCIEMEGFEADDLIATYARLAREAGADVTVISSDKDLMQLVGPQVSMYDSMKDRQIGVPEVIEKWGVPPEKMIDLQALTGDSVDNVPGIPGIGPKTAAQLIEEFGDLDTLLERASEIKQNKRRENIIEFADKARISRELVRLKDDVDVTEKLDELVLNPLDGPKLVAFLKGMEFTSLTRRVAEATETDASAIDAAEVAVDAAAEMRGPDLDPGQANGAASSSSGTSAKGDDTPQGLAKRRAEATASAKIDTSAYETLRDIDELKAWCAMARERGLVAFDTETTSLDAMQAELVGFSLALPETAPDTGDLKVRACYAPLAHSNGTGDLLGGGGAQAGQMPMQEALSELKALLEDPAVLKIGQNLKYDMAGDGAARHRSPASMTPCCSPMCSRPAPAATAWIRAVGALARPHADRLQGRDRLRQERRFPSPCADRQGDRLRRRGCRGDAAAVARAQAAAGGRRGCIGLRAAGAAAGAGADARMERAASVDRQILSRLSGELAQGAAALEARSTNWPARIQCRLAQAARRDPVRQDGPAGRQEDQDRAMVDHGPGAGDLAAAGHELPRKIVDWRQLTKLKSTYTDALPGYINPETKRVHTSFRWRRPPPGGCPRRIRTCRTSRCARRRAARSAPPSSPNRATS
jgi:DNA polymerase-1